MQVTRCLLLLALLSLTPGALADWELDSANSAINFVSIKNASVGESHSFTSMAGRITTAGAVQIAIDLDSVETLIEIRNERVRELLFETAKFPAANISARVEPELLQEVAGGATRAVRLAVTLDLHGQQKKLSIPVLAMPDSEGTLRVVSSQPVLLNASEFGLEAGIAALQKVAGLSSISTSVPVTLQLVFRPVL